MDHRYQSSATALPSHFSRQGYAGIPQIEAFVGITSPPQPPAFLEIPAEWAEVCESVGILTSSGLGRTVVPVQRQG